MGQRSFGNPVGEPRACKRAIEIRRSYVRSERDAAVDLEQSGDLPTADQFIKHSSVIDKVAALSNRQVIDSIAVEYIAHIQQRITVSGCGVVGILPERTARSWTAVAAA